jgi:MGT family glycosyltransferase
LQQVIRPIHERFNAFLAEHGEAPYPPGQFFEASPYLNLLLYPEPVRFTRRHPLDPSRYQYLQGCVRQEQSYSLPVDHDKPIVYVSFGSLGSGDTKTLRRLIDALGEMDLRSLVNVGGYLDAYHGVPDNVIIDKWFPQPSVIAQVDAVIHHGGNNTFTECLYFGKPAIIMPYVWDGHDNATRVEETGHGIKMHRNQWQPDELAQNLTRVLTDKAMHSRLAATSAYMRQHPGPPAAARSLLGLLGL